MILIVRRPAYAAGGWGYLGEEAGDEWEPLAPAENPNVGLTSRRQRPVASLKAQPGGDFWAADLDPGRRTPWETLRPVNPGQGPSQTT